MALSTYAELQAHIADDIDRDDMTARIPIFIAMTEAEMSAKLRTAYNTATATITFASTGLADAPTGFREPRMIKLAANPFNSLKSVTFAEMVELRAYGQEAGSPTSFVVEGEAIRCHPAPSADTSAECLYYRDIPALSDSNTSNWVLEKHPELYLEGALMYANGFLKDPEVERSHRIKFEHAVQVLNAVAADQYGDNATMTPAVAP